jgi:hypothetical protein
MIRKLDLVKASLSSADLLGFGTPASKTGEEALVGSKSVTAMVGSGVPKLPRTVAAKIGGPKTQKPV